MFVQSRQLQIRVIAAPAKTRTANYTYCKLVLPARICNVLLCDTQYQYKKVLFITFYGVQLSLATTDGNIFGMY